MVMCAMNEVEGMIFRMGLFGLFKNKEKKVEETHMPSAEQILKDAESLRQQKEIGIEESELPDIICTIYSATKNIDLDIDYVKEILAKGKNDNMSN